MSSKEGANKPHVICIPIPVQSHIKAMLKLAKLLHHKGFHITFVNTEFNHKRFLKSLGPNSLDGLPDFQFKTIPDGLPVSNEDATQDISLLGESIMKNFLAPFRDLVIKLNNNVTAATSTNISSPPVTCIASDGLMLFATKVAEELGIPIALLFPFAACAFMGYKQYPALVEKGLAPLKDESCLTNGFLDKLIDWIPGMKGIRLKDLPTEFRTTNPSDLIFNGILDVMGSLHRASAVVLHTFDALEPDVLDALSSTTSMLPPVYAIGPLQLLLNQIQEDPLKPIGYSLWKEETECLQWLNNKAPNSVVYVNFGSIVVMTPQQLVEFGWGLATTTLPFLWVIRPDLVVGESAVLPPEFLAETKERGLITSWCPQEQVLNHPSVGGFLTHSGWNSTIESLCAGVPMLSLPFFAEQQTNCYYTCKEWGIGLEINNDVKRDEVKKLVRELMEREKGKEMKNKVMEWKKLAEEATAPHGSSSKNLDNLVKRLQVRKTS
ncbi:7-deoxyloganetin glucosyltransferase-like [Rosa rugosa]|uniref:7-deoxyloganetin glucosyltransferase-like n=1 Tax=Rosa rugosa TaxID=74645 RepID=UPI002B40C03F|nr:7-deoxyloganetin glucosyltransferase-like [Rosa rugosa]